MINMAGNLAVILILHAILARDRAEVLLHKRL